MRKLFTTVLTVFTAYIANAQPTIGSGFQTGMAAINGTSYTHTGNIGTGNYQYVCASKNEPYFFAASFNRNYLYYVDVSTSAIVDSFPATMYDITSSNEDSTLFGVGNSDVLYRFNTTAKAFVDSTTLTGLWRLEERPGIKEVWATGSSKIYVVDYTAGLSAAPFTFSPVSSADGGGIHFTPGGSMAYISCSNTNKVYKIDANTKTVLDSAAVPAGNYCTEVSHDSSKLFVSAPGAYRIYIYNASTLALTDSINTGTREPFMLYRHPSRQEIWAVNHFKDSVTVYNENTYAVIAAFGISPSPMHLAFSSGATGINSLLVNTNDITLYPNPASKSISLRLPDGKARSLILSDIFGKCIKKQTVSAENITLDISALPTGTYNITILQGSEVLKTMNWVKS